MSVLVFAVLFFPAVLVGQLLGWALVSGVVAVVEWRERRWWERHPKAAREFYDALRTVWVSPLRSELYDAD